MPTDPEDAKASAEKVIAEHTQGFDAAEDEDEEPDLTFCEHCGDEIDWPCEALTQARNVIALCEKLEEAARDLIALGKRAEALAADAEAQLSLIRRLR